MKMGVYWVLLALALMGNGPNYLAVLLQDIVIAWVLWLVVYPMVVGVSRLWRFAVSRIWG